MDRKAWLLQGLAPASRILEIGPSHNPLAPKSAGWRTHVVDHAPQDELRAKYAGGDVDIVAIEAVDTVWQGGALHEALGPQHEGGFDAILASHVIEHLPDLLGFLISATRLLAPAGRIVLAVPDRRFCFDFFKPLATTGDVIEAHAAGRSRHARRTVWNQHAYSVTLDGRGAWGFEPTTSLAFATPFAAAADIEAAYRDDPQAEYADCHAWHFTPARFRLILLELGQLGASDWRIVELAAPGGAEFLCRLVRPAEPIADEASLQARRMALLREGLVELREQLDWALGARTAAAALGPDWGALSLLRGPAR